MRIQSFALVAFGVIALQTITLAQQVNTAEAALVVNGNSAGSFPLSSYMGVQDPNLITVDGTPGARYMVLVDRPPTLSKTRSLGLPKRGVSDSQLLAHGFLDANGHADVMFVPNRFRQVPLGATAVVRALVRGSGKTLKTSGETIVQFLSTMSSMVEQVPAAGSTARARGPLTSIGVNTISVGNLPFVFIAQTEWAGLLGPESLVLGDWVVLDGRYGVGGTLIVDEVNLEDPEPMVRLKGPVEGIGISGLAILGRSVYATNATTYVDGVLPAAFSDVTVGMVVEVMVPLATAEGFPQAFSMSLNSPVEVELEPEPEPEVEIEIELPPPAPAFCS